MSELNTRPATEADLMIANDVHMMDGSGGHNEPWQLHDVLIDGMRAKAGVGSIGTYSERILIVFEDGEHPDLGDEFSTKYWIFDQETPGLVKWGHEGKSFQMELILP